MNSYELFKKLTKERDEKINSNIRFYNNMLGNKKGYKLYSTEIGDIMITTPSKKVEKKVVVTAPKKVVSKDTGYKTYDVEIGDVEPKRSVSKTNDNVKVVSPKDETNKKQEPKHLNKKSGKKKNKKKKKGIIAAAIALGMAGVMAVTGFIVGSKLKKRDNGSNTGNSISDVVDDKIDTASLDSLGEQLPTQGKNSEYTKVSGDFNIEDVVRGADGRLYVDEESAKNAAKSGSVSIDTKGGTLTVADNGKVYTQSEGYVIVDENGNVVESGEGTPSMEEGVDYVECPCNYYDDEGTLVHSAGELITPQELEICKTYYHTTKPSPGQYDKVEEEIIYEDGYSEEDLKSDTSSIGSQENKDDTSSVGSQKTEETVQVYTNTSSNEGVTNADGTYTIYGVTYLSYADYQQYIISSGEGYGYIDGIIQPIGDYEIEYQYTK